MYVCLYCKFIMLCVMLSLCCCSSVSSSQQHLRSDPLPALPHLHLFLRGFREPLTGPQICRTPGCTPSGTPSRVLPLSVPLRLQEAGLV